MPPSFDGGIAAYEVRRGGALFQDHARELVLELAVGEIAQGDVYKI